MGLELRTESSGDSVALRQSGPLSSILRDPGWNLKVLFASEVDVTTHTLSQDTPSWSLLLKNQQAETGLGRCLAGVTP